MADDKHTPPEVDRLTGIATTGHEWDGIKELNTPLPRWWLWTFYATIVWAIGYMVVYPAIPLISSHTVGLLGHTNRAAVQVELAKLETQRTIQAAGLADASFEQIKANPDLNRIALARGKAAFGDNCMGCHGAGGMGFVGYPNLADDDWIWGGSFAAIHATITHGIRAGESDEERISQMPRFVADGVLTLAQANDTAEYVLHLSGRSTDAAARGRGETLYAENCVACHGEQGEGNRDVGAPRLNDRVWLYGADKQAIARMIANPRQGVMPSWGRRLDPAVVNMLTVYVHALGGGER